MNKELLAELYLRYAREVYLYVYSLCRSRAAAEDLTQETFVRALVSLNDAHPNFRAWLYLTAKNLCLNEIKREKRNKGGKTEAFSGEKKDLLEEYLKTERERLLYACIRRLPQMSRQIIFLEYFAALPVKEIAEVMQISPGNVRVIACRARKELRQLVERAEEGGGSNEI